MTAGVVDWVLLARMVRLGWLRRIDEGEEDLLLLEDVEVDRPLLRLRLLDRLLFRRWLF